MLKIGDFAPDFTLMNKDGQGVSLSDFRGKKITASPSKAILIWSISSSGSMGKPLPTQIIPAAIFAFIASCTSLSEAERKRSVLKAVRYGAKDFPLTSAALEISRP